MDDSAESALEAEKVLDLEVLLELKADFFDAFEAQDQLPLLLLEVFRLLLEVVRIVLPVQEDSEVLSRGAFLDGLGFPARFRIDSEEFDEVVSDFEVEGILELLADQGDFVVDLRDIVETVVLDEGLDVVEGELSRVLRVREIDDLESADIFPSEEVGDPLEIVENVGVVLLRPADPGGIYENESGESGVVVCGEGRLEQGADCSFRGLAPSPETLQAGQLFDEGGFAYLGLPEKDDNLLPGGASAVLLLVEADEGLRFELEVRLLVFSELFAHQDLVFPF